MMLVIDFFCEDKSGELSEACWCPEQATADNQCHQLVIIFIL